MVYKVYISTLEGNQQYVAATQQALFSINEIGVSALGADDIPVLGNKRHQAAKHMIRQADVFIGIYDEHYGDIPDGETQSHIEIEYEEAIEQDKARLIFMVKGALEKADERQQAFLEHVMQNNVVTMFEDIEELGAQIKVGLANYRETKQHRRKLIPPPPGFRDKLPPLPGQPSRQSQQPEKEEISFEERVEDALQFVREDVEQIVRRALELHDAQNQMNKATVDSDFDNKITVEPMWGEPIRRSQFQSDIFMIMPFRERFNNVYEHVIRPVAADLNLTIKRGDEFASTRGSIMQEVWAALNACKLVICETTAINANVYYELGIAHTLGKPAILLTQTKEVEQLPFDIRHLRFSVYDDNVEGYQALEASLRRSIIWLMNDLDEQVE